MTTYAGPFSTEDYAYAPDQSAAWGVALLRPPYNVQEIEERDFGRGPLLWDADPDVCCAAFQLGACPHTEGEDGDLDWDEEWDDIHDDEEVQELTAIEVINKVFNEPF